MFDWVVCGLDYEGDDFGVTCDNELNLARVSLACSTKIDSLDGSSFMVMSSASLNFPPSSVLPWEQEFNLRLQPCFSWDWP